MRDIVLIGILGLSLLFTGCQEVGSYTDKNGDEFDKETSKVIDELIAEGVNVEDITDIMIYNYKHGTDIEQGIVGANLTVSETLQDYMRSISDYRANNDSFKEVYEETREYISSTQIDLKSLLEVAQELTFEDETIKDDTMLVLKNIENNVLPFFDAVDNFIRTENEKYKLQATNYYNEFNEENEFILEMIDYSKD